ncbi:MAG TPA: hypothetical protein PK874_13780 [Desulfobacteraceae bacterium]|mgnify:FL=1|nr:hypothetical protein [Desulfobacteraceae bacterium]
MTEKIFRLFPKSSFFEGVGRLVDFTGSLNEYNISETPEEADTRALYSDWRAVGIDLLAAKEEHNKSAACGEK